MTENYQIINGDCLEEMKNIPDGSIDLCLTDPPYGTTACKWDSVIPFEPMWKELKRIVKPKGAICLFGSQPFTSILVASNLKMFKYQLVWRKSKAQHFAQAPYRFMTEHEEISVFSESDCAKNAKSRMVFYPQGLKDCEIKKKGKTSNDHRPCRVTQSDYIQLKTNYPKSILEFNNDSSGFHPTQKPVELLRYLIKTYTQENETVLDFTTGSGSTGVACMLENRKFIGIEKDSNYFEIAKNRIEEAINKQPLLMAA